jgi:nitroreductase
MDKKSVIPEILKRRSHVCFSGETLTSDEIDILIEASKWAPSSRNSQPWRIVIVRKEGPTFNQLVKSLNEGNQEWAKDASALVVFAINNDSKGLHNRFLDIGFCGQNMMLQAEKLGLVSHPMGGWRENQVKTAVEIPADKHVVFVLALGRTGRPQNLNPNLSERHGAPRTRNPSEVNFCFDKWEDNWD